MQDSMGILGGCIVPHPPLLVPDVGGRDIRQVDSTRESMEKLGEKLDDLKPDVLVMISPHGPVFRDAFDIKTEGVLEGSFAQFRCPQVRIRKRNDTELAGAVARAAESGGLPVGSASRSGFSWSAQGEELDHGLLVPLYYLDRHLETPIVSMSISGLDYRSHFALGAAARRACEELGRKAVFVASGDLSHRLLPGAPAGYNPRGEEFDRSIVDISSRGDFDELYSIDEELIEAAGECGLRSIHTMWGSLKNGELNNSVLSYEGPFGVGYMVSVHIREGLGGKTHE